MDPATLRAARRALTLPEGPPLDLRLGDALAPVPAWPERSWILANPPWVSFSGRQSQGTGRPRRAGGWPSLHGAFLERIAEHVAAQNTGAIVLLPAAVADAAQYAPLRDTVERHCTARVVAELGETAFPGVIEPAIELALSPRSDPAGSSGPWSRSEHADALRSALARSPRLPDRSFADPGVHTGNSARELVQPEDRTEFPPVYQGRDLAAYRLGPASARLRVDLERSSTRRFRIAPLERYREFPVLIRQTSDRPVAALHEPASYFRNSLLACRAIPELSPDFVVAVLNGPLAAVWHKTLFRDARQRAFPQVKVSHLKTVPFPLVSRGASATLHDEIARSARALRERRVAPTASELEALGERTLDAYGLTASLREFVLARYRAAANKRSGLRST